jgi:acyl carrier protein
MAEVDINPALTRIFRQVFDRPDLVLNAAMTARDVQGWDSFKQIEIIIAVEEHFRIELDSKEMDNLNSVGDLVKIVNAKARTAT